MSIGDISEQVELPLLASGEITSLGNDLYSVKGHAFKLKLTEFTAGPEALAGEVGGSVDVAVPADTPVIFAAEQGVNLKVVAVDKPNLPGADFAIVVPKGSAITSLAQLKGHSVSVQTGTINEYLLVEALKSAGLSVSDITEDNLTPALAEAALANGSVQAAVLPQPYVALEQAGGATVLTTGAGLVEGYAFYTATAAALKNKYKAAAIGDLLSILRRAQLWVAANTSSFITTAAATYGLPASLTTVLITNSEGGFVPITPAIIASSQTQANVFFKQGELLRKLTIKPYFDTGYNALVVKLNKEQ